MNKKLKVEKLKMWNENLKKLEGQLVMVQQKKSLAQEGDLTEEDVETLRAQIEQVKKIIADLEK